MRKEGKPHGNKNPPQKTMHQKKKRQLLGNCVLHSKTIPQSLKLQLSEGLGEDIDSLFRGRTKLQINDHVMYQISDEMHVDINVFGSLPLYWISLKSQCTLIVTPYDSWTVKLDTKLGKEVLKSKCLNDTVDYSYVLDLYRR